MLTAYHFSRHSDLFTDYINHFYDLKKTASANKDLNKKGIAKLHLNSLYGMFGRSLEVLKSIITRNDNQIDIVTKYPVKSIIKVNDDLSIFLTHANVDYNLIKQTNSELSLELITQTPEFVKTNVAIASAIASYARIEMMKFKNIPGVKTFYTDTDSIFVDKELPAHLVGDELGQMKDELDGGFILKAWFFGIKKYAYLDNNNNLTTLGYLKIV